MEISEKWWTDYVRRLSAISAEAGELMQEYLDENLFDDDYAMIEYAYALATRYGEAAAALACEMYDSVADASGLFLPPAEPAPTATFEETAAAVRGTQKNRRNSVPDTVSRLTKQAAADTTLQNAQRDGAQFAWVPHGDTCAFCMMLASNGWQNMSRKALKNGHAEHIHANCDCEYAIRFDDSTTIAGYDPDRYYDMYRNAEGSTWEEKVNSMRREQYARNKEYINAQKRAAYAERKERKPGLQYPGGSSIVKPRSEYQLSSHNMHNSSEELYERVNHVTPIPGYDDVFAHGDAWGVSTKDANGIDIPIPGEAFIETLKNLKLENGAIRLCACSTGAADNGFASYVAKKMGMPVMAPSTDVWVTMPDKNGVSKMELFEDNGKGKQNREKPGRWRIFFPDGTIQEASK